MNKRKGSKIGFFIASCAVCYFLYIVFVYQSNIIKSKNENIKQLQAKIEKEKKEGKRLNAYKDNVESDEFIEKIAREKLRMIKPNERVFVDTNK